ncbi:glycosyltransferase family 2 protein [Pedobacter aquatilis]|uniref:glycosyltransferase family 2 protein n=1 Tax=Pedobacter aquatilis TaxID=351343 RepID=UPI00292FE740|nr:glycosyltransferase family 2 protein [Pedobacter aquatilis]
MPIPTLVTIIIPTYNRADKIATAVESALAQTYQPIQLIVIDDGSTDHTKAIISNYPEVEYYYKQNGGQASARNLGLNFAKGSIIASLDSDDEWYPDYLKQNVGKLEADQLDFVFANWDQENTKGQFVDYLSNEVVLKELNEKAINNWVNLDYEELRWLYVNDCPSPSSSVVMRKDSIVSGWDERMNIGDDWCLYLDMILSKRTTAAYTLKKLWRKGVDHSNIFDGRKHNEVLEYLYIADIRTKMEKFGVLLKPTELLVWQKLYMRSLIELSKYNLFRTFQIKKAFNLLAQSFKMNTLYTIKKIPVIYGLSMIWALKDKIIRK